MITLEKYVQLLSRQLQNEITLTERRALFLQGFIFVLEVASYSLLWTTDWKIGLSVTMIHWSINIRGRIT